MEPRAQGRGFIVRKRTSHINVILESREQQKGRKARRSIFSLRPRTEVVETADKPSQETSEGKAQSEKGKSVQGPKTRERIKKNLVDVKRRLFNRRSGE